MRKYGESGILLSVVCNRCGKKLAVKEGILREGAAHFDVAWDYFSEKDGEVHHFDLCEECYDGVTREFLIEADKEERTELLSSREGDGETRDRRCAICVSPVNWIAEFLACNIVFLYDIIK